MSALTQHYVQLAAQPVAKTAAQMPFPATFRRSVTSMDLVAVPSVAYPAQPDGDYTSLPHIHSEPLPQCQPQDLLSEEGD